MFLFLGSAFAILACDGSREGDRCNPALSHDECGADLQCTQPVDCPENYCCPKSGTSTSPYCQPGCAGGREAICEAGGEADCPSAGDGASDAGGG